MLRELQPGSIEPQSYIRRSHTYHVGNRLSPSPVMSRYEFTCPECGQEIEVNESMREATLSHGCPVCGAAVSAADFATEQPTN